MSNLDKLLNNYCVLQVLKNYAKLGDKDEIIFSNFEELIFFIDEIRAEEREACARVCERIERNGAWITKEEAAAAIRKGWVPPEPEEEVKPWVELTDDDIWDVMCKVDSFMYRTFARELEQKIKEKNL